MVNRWCSLSNPIRWCDLSETFSTFDWLANQFSIIFTTVNSSIFDETRSFLTQQVIALRASGRKDTRKVSKKISCVSSFLVVLVVCDYDTWLHASKASPLFSHPLHTFSFLTWDSRCATCDDQKLLLWAEMLPAIVDIHSKPAVKRREKRSRRCVNRSDYTFKGKFSEGKRELFKK